MSESPYRAPAEQVLQRIDRLTQNLELLERTVAPYIEAMRYLEAVDRLKRLDANVVVQPSSFMRAKVEEYERLPELQRFGLQEALPLVEASQRFFSSEYTVRGGSLEEGTRSARREFVSELIEQNSPLLGRL